MHLSATRDSSPKTLICTCAGRVPTRREGIWPLSLRLSICPCPLDLALSSMRSRSTFAPPHLPDSEGFVRQVGHRNSSNRRPLYRPSLHRCSCGHGRRGFDQLLQTDPPSLERPCRAHWRRPPGSVLPDSACTARRMRRAPEDRQALPGLLPAVGGGRGTDTLDGGVAEGVRL
jgi:hypothetical protein